MTNCLLKLSACDADDVQVIAAVLQDAIAPVCDMLYRAEDKCFVMIVHRFRWDDAQASRSGEPPCFERVHCAVEVGGVEGVQRHGIGEGTGCGMHELLTLLLENGLLRLVFAGGAEVRLKLGAWRLRIEDFGEPWPTLRRPTHSA